MRATGGILEGAPDVTVLQEKCFRGRLRHLKLLRCSLAPCHKAVNHVNKEFISSPWQWVQRATGTVSAKYGEMELHRQMEVKHAGISPVVASMMPILRLRRLWKDSSVKIAQPAWRDAVSLRAKCVVMKAAVSVSSERYDARMLSRTPSFREQEPIEAFPGRSFASSHILLHKGLSVNCQESPRRHRHHNFPLSVAGAQATETERWWRNYISPPHWATAMCW